MEEFTAVIGLELHAQLLTESKIFCGCPTHYGNQPNTNVCPVCLGLPGCLPVLNLKAVEYATRTALALNCSVSGSSVFARKSYFYPDLAKGYPISQYDRPLAEDGWLEYPDEEGVRRRARILRIHLEEDAGRLLHEGFQDSDTTAYIDFNRSGIPLVEIVSSPDIETPQQAYRYLRELKTMLQYLGVCDCNMGEGSLRCDANVSVRPAGNGDLGTRTEIRNMNSFRGVRNALEFEICRQETVLKGGGEVRPETFLWDEGSRCTVPMRGKEEDFDDRYFPEPDLLPLEVQPGWQEGIRSRLPELPSQVRERFRREYELTDYDVDLLTRTPGLAGYFEETAAVSGNPKAVSSWISTELLREIEEEDQVFDLFPVRPGQLAGLIGLIDSGRISGRTAKQVFQRMRRSGEDAEKIVEEEALDR